MQTKNQRANKKSNMLVLMIFTDRENQSKQQHRDNHSQH